MNKQDRVLIRKGARELEPKRSTSSTEACALSTLCTIGSTAQRDGDVSLGEC